MSKVIKKVAPKVAPRAAKKGTKVAPKVDKASPAKAAKPSGKVDLSRKLAKPQARILRFLGKAKKPCSRATISEGAPVDNAFCTEYIGSADLSIRAKNDAKVIPSLLTRGYVAYGETEGAATYVITAKGKAAYAAYVKEYGEPA